MANRDLPNISDSAKHITVNHFLLHHGVPETIFLYIRPDFLRSEESGPELIANYLCDAPMAMMTSTRMAMMTSIVVAVVVVAVLVANNGLLPNVSDSAKHIMVDHFLFHHSVPETISLHIRLNFLRAEESRPVLVANHFRTILVANHFRNTLITPVRMSSYLCDTPIAMMTTIVVVVALLIPITMMTMMTTIVVVVVVLVANSSLLSNVSDSAKHITVNHFLL